jgi:hypothetical protein
MPDIKNFAVKESFILCALYTINLMNTKNKNYPKYEYIWFCETQTPCRKFHET